MGAQPAGSGQPWGLPSCAVACRRQWGMAAQVGQSLRSDRLLCASAPSHALLLALCWSAGAEISAFLFNPQFVRQPRRSASLRERASGPAVAAGKVGRAAGCLPKRGGRPARWAGMRCREGALLVARTARAACTVHCIAACCPSSTVSRVWLGWAPPRCPSQPGAFGVSLDGRRASAMRRCIAARPHAALPFRRALAPFPSPT